MMEQRPKENNPSSPQKKITTVQELQGFLEGNRLAVYRAKDKNSAVMNNFMDTVDIMMDTIFVQDKTIKEYDATIKMLEAKLEKGKKKEKAKISVKIDKDKK